MRTMATVILAAIALGIAVPVPLQAEEDVPAERTAYFEQLRSLHKTPDEAKGLAIYQKQFLMDTGWKSQEVQMEMHLIDAAGHESRRKVVKRDIEEGITPLKTLGIFVEPVDVRGTVMLSFEQSFGSDQQWLYLPALKRTKRINAENKSGSFLGTEFSWEDLSTRELTKYKYQFLREEGNTFVVTRIPVYQFSGYSRQVTWVNKDNFQTVKIEYYDKKNDLLKTQVLGKWEQINGKFWRPQSQEMTNHINHKKTLIGLTGYRMDIGLDNKMFSSLALNQIQASELSTGGR